MLVLLAGLTACATPTSIPASSSADTRTAYVVVHGWHAGVALPRAAVAPASWPEVVDFPQAEYIEVGWGDADYYPAPDFRLSFALKALFLPTPSVLHLVGIAGPCLPAEDRLALDLPAASLTLLARYISQSHARDESGKGIVVAPGLYGGGRFYLSHESYHLFRTSNVWLARGLREAGVPVRPALAFSVSGLMQQLRALDFAHEVQCPVR